MQGLREPLPGESDPHRGAQGLLRRRLRAVFEPRAGHASNDVPDLVARWQEIERPYLAAPPQPRGRIGIPRASTLLDQLPFWAPFFARLGYEVVASQPSSQTTLQAGLRRLPAETCLPIKLAFGHVQELVEAGVDHIFLPSILTWPGDDAQFSYSCPYVQAVPYMIKAGLSASLLTPEIHLSRGEDAFVAGLAPALSELGVGRHEIAEAYRAASAAWAEFRRRMIDAGREVLDGLDRAIVVIGKPYNVLDPYLNLNLLKHLRHLGVTAIPMGVPADRGRRARRAGRSAPLAPEPHDRPRRPLLPGRRPPLPGPGLELRLRAGRLHADDPGADARRPAVAGPGVRRAPRRSGARHAPGGVSGRDRGASRGKAEGGRRKADGGRRKAEGGRRNVPSSFRLHPSAFSLPPQRRLASRSSFRSFRNMPMLMRARCGPRAMPPACCRFPPRKSGCSARRVRPGRNAIRIACSPATSSHLARSPHNGNEVFFFFGTTIPCLLHQYGEGHRQLLKRMNVTDLSVLTPGIDDLKALLGVEIGARLWRGLVAVDLLIKMVCETRPYELQHGQTDEVHRQNVKDVETAIATDELSAALTMAISRLRLIPVDRSAPRPVVGVAGDIYTRINPVGNQDLFLWLEERGCEVWPAPFLVDITDFSLRRDWTKGTLGEAALLGALMLRKNVESWRVRRMFRGQVKRGDEPGYQEVLDMATPYLGQQQNEVLVLNVAKMVDFARRGANGIINAVCFNCMLGTVSSAVTRRIREDHDGIPIANLVYSAVEGSQRAMLEAFLHQVKTYTKRRSEAALAAGAMPPPRDKGLLARLWPGG